MPISPSLTTFTGGPGNIIYASQVNSNFTNLRDTLNTYAVLTDVARTISVTHTWTAAQTFTGGWTAAAACTISSGGIAVTGNSTITGTLGSLTGLTVASGGATITAGGLTVTAGGATVTAGGLTVSASGITVTGNSTIDGTLGSLTGLTLASGVATNATQPRCYITATAAAVATTTPAAVAFDTEVLDVGGMWAIGNASRFVVPASAGGSYDLVFTGAYSNDTDGTCNWRWKKNGTTDIGPSVQSDHFSTTLAATDIRWITMHLTADLSAGDYIEMFAADNGGTTTFTGTMSARKVW